MIVSRANKAQVFLSAVGEHIHRTPRTGTTKLSSTVNMRSGFHAMGVLRPEGQASAEPVALETAVVATGARPGDATAKRELFAEETQTVLVFERGAVIRLSAAVADGQLLFLTNKKTGKEVVTQVVRKRSFRPTSCYVDLEFTEAFPGFWGIEFPKSAPALPSQMTSDPGEEEATESVKRSEPPDQQEIERLKKEVAELQNRLKTLSGSATNAVSSPTTSGDGESDSSSGKLTRERQEEKILAQLLAQEEQQEQLQGPKRLVAYPKKTTSLTVKAASKVATAGAFAAVIVAVVIAAYRFGLLDVFVSKSTATPVHTAVTEPSMPKPVVASTASANHAPPSQATPDTSRSASQSVVNKAPAGISSLPNVVEDVNVTNGTPASRAQNTTSMESKRPSSSRSDSFTGISEIGAVPTGNSTAVAASGGAPTAEDYIAPKLVHSVRSVSPPEALRNYVTGSVKVDALVDTTGHVKSVKVLSGPQKLYSTAIQEIKQYIYEPARKNGKPVASHVQASLQYWYEP